MCTLLSASIACDSAPTSAAASKSNPAKSDDTIKPLVGTWKNGDIEVLEVTTTHVTAGAPTAQGLTSEILAVDGGGKRFELTLQAKLDDVVLPKTKTVYTLRDDTTLVRVDPRDGSEVVFTRE